MYSQPQLIEKMREVFFQGQELVEEKDYFLSETGDMILFYITNPADLDTKLETLYDFDQSFLIDELKKPNNENMVIIGFTL